MSLVVDASRAITPICLVREGDVVPEGNETLNRANKQLSRGLETYFTGLTGLQTTVVPSGAAAVPRDSDGDVFILRALGWDPLLPPLELAFSRLALARLVDCFYGGSGTEITTSFAPSASENKFLDRVADGIGPLLGAAWRGSATIAPKLVPNATEQHDGCVVSLMITCGEWPPFEIKLTYPRSSLEALTSSGPSDAATGPPDDTWDHDLTALVLAVPFPVRTILAEPEVAISQLARLSVGDVLPIRVLPQMDLNVGGIRIAKGTVGDREGRAAFRLD